MDGHQSKRYEWDFAFTYDEHQTKTRDEAMVATGFTVRKQRWSLTVYDKRVEITDAHPHRIKQSYFETLAKKDEPITRVELRIKSAEALVAVQGALKAPCEEAGFCQAILKHWAKYHRIRTRGGHEESRFKKLFCDFVPKRFERSKKEKIARLRDEHREMRIRDMARDFIRYGMTQEKTTKDITDIFQEQMDWLKENEELSKAKPLLPSRKPKGGPSGRP